MVKTGIIEEIALETLYRNPYRRYPMWDAILFELINNEKNITPILNCSCNDIEMDGSKIKKVIGWQTTTQCYHIIEAKFSHLFRVQNIVGDVKAEMSSAKA